LGGSGGGGNAGQSFPSDGVNATTNSGGGGGGATSNSNDTTNTGGNGGSGVVIIRYSDIYPAAASTTGSPTVTVTGGYRIYVFNSSGSITF
jgi:hypothetical protein